MPVTIEQVPKWTVDRGIGHAVMWGQGYVQTACGIWGTLPKPTPKRPKRICKACRAKLATLSLTPPAASAEG